MKLWKTSIFMGIIAILFLAIGCNEGNWLKGTWESSNNVLESIKIEFSGNKFTQTVTSEYLNLEDYITEGTYIISYDQIEFSYSHGEEWSAFFSLDGDVMMINEDVFTRVSN